MSQFLDNDFVLANAHVPLAEVEQDIRDTESEITEMQRKLPHLRGLAEADPRDRMVDLRARACADGIAERQEFVRKLRLIIEHRKAAL